MSDSQNNPVPEDDEISDDLNPGAFAEELGDDVAAAADDQNESDGGRMADRIAELEEQLAHSKDQMLRVLADAENTKRLALKERDDGSKYAVASFARDILGFADNFRRGIEAIPQELKSEDDRVAGVVTGIESMEKDLLGVFDKHGIHKIEPMGEIFNPNFHEVMFETPGTGKPAGTVVQVVEAGYLLKDRLLRPARVGVAKDEGQGQGSDGNPGAEPGVTIDTEA